MNIKSPLKKFFTVMIWCLLGGAVLGVLFGFMNQVRRPMLRLGLSLGLAVGLVAAALVWFGQFENLFSGWDWASPIHNKALFGAQLLLGMPFFYLLTFAGREEETEIEIGMLCAALGLGWTMLATGGTMTAAADLCQRAGYQLQALAALIDLNLVKNYSWQKLRLRAAINF